MIASTTIPKRIADQKPFVDDPFENIGVQFRKLKFRMERSFEKADSRFDKVDSRLNTMDSRFDKTESHFVRG
jgi:hypothetical protein